MARSSFHVFVVAAALAVGRFGSAEPPGSIVGSVRAPDGTPLPQLVLALAGPAGSRTVVTGPEGRFRVGGLEPGAYTLEVQTPGFQLSPAASAAVADAEVRLDLRLSPAPVREHVVVAATRGDAALSTLGVAAAVLDRERLAEREPSDVLHLLQDVPGVAVARSGGLGVQASAFLRGGESRFARVLVDGVPVNEPGGYYNFGAELPLELERIEVVRGAASSLYGTDALAGVIHLVTRRAEPGEAPSVHGEAEGGGFAWRRGAVGTTGQRGRFDWNAGALRLETDNEQPNNAFRETAGALALGARLGEGTSLRLVARGEDSDVGTPGPTAYRRPDLDAGYERSGLVLGAQLRHARERISHELRSGLARTDQLSTNPRDSGPFVNRSGGRTGFSGRDFPDPLGFRNDTRRLSAGYQADLEAGSRHLVSAGADLERETGELGSRSAPPLLSPERTNFGVYLQDRAAFTDRLFVTLGARLERNDNFGTQAVPRAALAWRVRAGKDATTLRASAGVGIKEPSFFESFGVSFFAKGNPDLKPERSRTYDVGVEQRLLGDQLRAEATLFHHDYRDQIAFVTLDFTTFQGSYVNLGRTRGRGVELSVEAAAHRSLRLAAAYTYLDGEIVTSSSGFDPVLAAGKPLLRRPPHQASFWMHAGTERYGVGASLVLVGERADSDFAGLGLERNEAYARFDARARLTLGRGFSVFVAGENLLDREYQEVLGYPALGRSIRAGLRMRK
jgi:vitamin B12 transporter